MLVMLGRSAQRHCPNDGDLRALIDEGFEASQATRLHAERCPRCAKRLAELRETAKQATQLMSRLEAGSPAEATIAFAKLRHAAEVRGVAFHQGGSFMTGLWDRRAMRAATAMVALVAVMGLLIVTPMGSVASDMLNRFRVEKFAAITIEADQFSEFQTEMLLRLSGSDPEELLAAAEGLFTYESTFDLEDPMANVTELGSAAEAEARFGPFVEAQSLPDGFSDTPTYSMSEAGSVDVSIDTAAVQTLVNELELPIYSLPDAAEHPTIDISMAASPALVLEYAGLSEDQHIVVGQLASPTLTTPDYLNMDQLREDILRLPGLPADFVAQLRAISDWESTLIIPVPEGYSSEDVTIDGEPGLLLAANEGDESVVIFEKSGMLYIVAGTASGDAILDVAKSLS
jgi:hypothetical protein